MKKEKKALVIFIYFTVSKSSKLLLHTYNIINIMEHLESD